LIAALVGLLPDREALPPYERAEAARKLRQAFEGAASELATCCANGTEQRGHALESLLPQTVLRLILGSALQCGTGEFRCVCRGWLCTLQSLGILRTLNASVLPPTERTSMAGYLRTLRSRPCSVRLSALRMPPGLRLSPNLAHNAVDSCPELVSLDLGYFSSGVVCAPEALLTFARGLPRLSHVRVALRSPEGPSAAESLVRLLGSRLRELRIETGFVEEGYMGDALLHALGAHCTELRAFALHNDGERYHRPWDRLAGDGLRSMVDGCAHLEELELGLVTNASLPGFEHLAERLEGGGSSLRRLQVFGVLALETPAGLLVERRLQQSLPPGAFTTSGEAYRELLRQTIRCRSSLFVPDIEYLRGMAVD